jgi:chromosome partitioning protein
VKILAVASSKGGVGKTSVAVHLSVGFAREGRRTLLVDLDPGGHATTWLHGPLPDQGIADSIAEQSLEPEHVVQLSSHGLWLAPATSGLSTVEAAVANEFGREAILSELLRASRKPQFDAVIIDCPPTRGFLTQAAIYASDDVVSPMLPSYLGLSGVVDVRGLVDQVRKRGKRRVRFAGALLFAADDRERVTEETRAALRAIDARALYKSEVRMSTAGKHLPELRTTAWDAAGADARGAADYAAVLRETQERIGAR